jgi:hypothetical protein
MNKKFLILTIISLTLLIAISFTVYAAPVKFTETLSMMGKFLFEDLPTMGDFGFKFLLWILLFALFDFGLKKAHFVPKTAGILSLVLSLGVVIVSPPGMIKYLFNMYWLIVVLILGVLVPIILFWVVHKNFGGNTTPEILLRGVMYIIIGIALFYFSAYSGNFVTG